MKVLLLAAFLPLTVFADPLEGKIQAAINFVESQQTKNSPDYDVGQWPAEVISTLPDFLGIGQNQESYPEPSAFVAASVANVLAELYFIDNHYTKIPAIVERALTGIESYREGAVFNFYPPKDYNGLTIRGPRALYLHPRWYGFANIPADSDTTSVTYLMQAYSQAMHNQTKIQDSKFALSQEVVAQFSRFRDANRQGHHLYNVLHGYEETGGFLTWLFDEEDPNMPHDYFAPPEQGKRIPFNANDVDCVVNSNVLKLLSVANRSDADGYEESCNLLNRISRDRSFYHCGMYYPSNYVLPYGIASAIDLGVKCLEPSRDELLDEVLSKQMANGAWDNAPARADYVQSTAWALNTLLLLGDPENQKQRLAAQKAIDYLSRRAIEQEDGRLYWPGEIFYAATFVVRQNIVWHSAAYTTAVVAKALTIANKKWNLQWN